MFISISKQKVIYLFYKFLKLINKSRLNLFRISFNYFISDFHIKQMQFKNILGFAADSA